MPRIVEVSDRADPNIAPYLDIREHDLVGRQGKFIAEGEVVVRVLLGSARHQPLSLFLAEKRLSALTAAISELPDSVPVYVAPQMVMDAVAGFPIHRGILALGERADARSADSELDRIGARALVVVLFGIANHDNMGGIFRNAAAFDADLVLVSSDCCDPLYRKAIRVSAGHALTVPFARLERGSDPLVLLAERAFEVIALSPNGEHVLADTALANRVAVLFGAEGPGLPESVLHRCRTVSIPIASDVDSLNVSTASGIVLHHVSRLMSDSRGG